MAPGIMGRLGGAFAQARSGVPSGGVISARQPEGAGVRLRGREGELEEVKAALGANRVVVIGGAAGIGKSMLGRALAESLEMGRRGIWVECKKGMGLESLVSALSNFFAEEYKGFASILLDNLLTAPELVVNRFAECLDQGDNVLFLDDFESVTDRQLTHDLLKALSLGPTQACTVVLTKEVGMLRAALAGEHSVELVLGSVDSRAGLDLLEDRGLGARSQQERGRLHERTAGHPLALELCAGLLLGGMTIEEIEKLPLFRRGGDEEKSVRRILQEIEGRLSAQELHFLRSCSVFDEPFGDSAMAAVCPTEHCAEVAERVQPKFLLSHRNGRYDLHPLVREYFYDGLKDEAASVHELAGRYYLGKAKEVTGEAERLTRKLKAHRHFELAKDYRQLIDLHREVFRGLVSASRAQEAARICQATLDASTTLNDKKMEGSCLSELGLIRSNQGRVDEAVHLLKRSLSIARQTGDRAGENAALGNLGAAYYGQLEVQKAIECFEGALPISREMRDRRGELNHLSNLGNAYAYLGEVQKAIGCYEQVLEISREIGDRRGQESHLGKLGNACSELGEVQKAVGYYEQALEISTEVGDRRGEGDHVGNLGLAYANLGEAQKAIEYHEQALEISREIGDGQMQGNVLGNLGNVYADLGKVQKAIGYYEQALKISRGIEDRRGQGTHLCDLGTAYHRLGEVQKAVEHYEQALEISREIGDRRTEGNALGNLGNAYGALGKMRKAAEHFQEALEISRQIGDRRMEANVMGNLGNVFAALGEVPKAIDYYHQALGIAREMRDRRVEGNHLGNLGNAYAALVEVPKAINCYEQALEIAKEIGDRHSERTHLHNLGDELTRVGQNAGALACLVSAVEIGRAIGDPRVSGTQERIVGLKRELGEEEFGRLLEQVEPNKERIIDEMLAAAAATREGDAGRGS
jgi:tetratricopeptide (TPR) repeat protein